MRKITTGRYEFKGYIYCLCTMRTKWYSLGNFSTMYFCINRLTTDTPLNGPTCYQEGPKTPLANIYIYLSPAYKESRLHTSNRCHACAVGQLILQFKVIAQQLQLQFKDSETVVEGEGQWL